MVPIKNRAMRDSLLETIFQMMLNDDKIFFVTADFGSPVVDKIKTQKKHRFINVGIAEQNLINVSAGLALEGFTVFCYAIAPFITMRCFEQIRVSLSLLSKVRKLNVNLIGVGAGYSYVVSGPTHQCYEDITLMRSMPPMKILSASDQVLASSFIPYCLKYNGPKYLRLDAQVLPIINSNDKISMEQGFIMHGRLKGNIIIISTGYMTHTALKIQAIFNQNDNTDITVLDLFNITHFNKDKFNALIKQFNYIISMEEGFTSKGGVDSMLFDHFNKNKINTPYLNIGVENDYRFEIGSRDDLHEQVGIGLNASIKKIKKFIERQ